MFYTQSHPTRPCHPSPTNDDGILMSEQTPAALSAEDEARLTSVKKRVGRGAVIGAIFLMATSAIGPGFITQTATFTQTMGASFAFAILISVIIDIAVQLNIWRMITSSGKRAGELANSAIPLDRKSTRLNSSHVKISY